MVREGFRRRGGPPWEWWGKEAKERKAKGYIKAAAMEGRRARRQARSRREEAWWLTPACRLWVLPILGDKLGLFRCLFMDMAIACMERQKIIQQMHVESASGC